MVFFSSRLGTVSIATEIWTHDQEVRGKRVCYFVPHNVGLRVAVEEKDGFSFSSPNRVYLDFMSLDFLPFEVSAEHIFVYLILTRHTCFPQSCRSKTVIEYKGYVAVIEFDDSVGRLHGRVIDSSSYSIATFEATDVKGIREEFHRSIDEYIASCEEDGLEPIKPFSGKLNVRLGSDLHKRIVVAAEESEMSLNNWIVHALEKSVSRRPS